MRPYGDFPLEHAVILDELLELEDWFVSNGNEIEPDVASMGFCSMAHDYFFIECEEEAERLLDKAEKLYPGYFKEKIHEHIRTNQDFGILIDNLNSVLAPNFLKKYGYRDVPFCN